MIVKTADRTVLKKERYHFKRKGETPIAEIWMGKRGGVLASQKLLWAIRWDTENWALKKKWKGYYSLEEIVNIPPLKRLSAKSDESWKIAVRETKRYEVAIIQEQKF